MNGVKNKIHHFREMLTSTQTYRPQNLTIYVKFHVESKFEVENAQFLCLDLVFF